MAIKAGSMKWQAGPGMLFCEKESYQLAESSIILPGDNTKLLVFRVISVGPDVTGFKEGDIVGTPSAHTLGGKDGKFVFVHVKNVMGRLVPLSAPNSARAEGPYRTADNGEPLPRGGAELTSDVDGEKLVNDMAAAD
jgi:hypothetical protein